MSYRDLQIWVLARKVALEVHKLTLTELPKFEMYEVGSQIRRSVKSIGANIVEGYGRRRYKQDFVRFLTYAHASCDESIEHLEVLFESGSLKNKSLFEHLNADLNTLGAKLNRFIASVDDSHQSVKEELSAYQIPPESE